MVLSWLITHIGLLGTSYFPYMIGMLFCKKQVISLLRQQTAAIGRRTMQIITLIIFVCMIVAHGIVPPLFVLENEPISRLLKTLQKAKTHVAVVVDE